MKKKQAELEAMRIYINNQRENFEAIIWKFTGQQPPEGR